jgi:tRNA(His) 5'-end guanylyltransferase
MQFTLCGKRQLTKLTGFSNSTFKRFRRSGQWIEGIHYHEYNSRCIRYVPELCRDYFENQQIPEAHQRLVDKYTKQKENR